MSCHWLWRHRICSFVNRCQKCSRIYTCLLQSTLKINCFFFNTNEQWKQILSKINKFITVTLGVNISAWRLSSNKGKKKGTWLKRLNIFFLNRGQMWKFCFWFLFCFFFRFFMCLLHNSDGQKSRFNFYTFVAVDFPLFQ